MLGTKEISKLVPIIICARADQKSSVGDTINLMQKLNIGEGKTPKSPTQEKFNDIVIALGSSDLGDSAFQALLSLFSRLIQGLDEEKFRFGLVQFTNEVSKSIPLTPSKSEFLQKLRNLTFKGHYKEISYNAGMQASFKLFNDASISKTILLFAPIVDNHLSSSIGFKGVKVYSTSIFREEIEDPEELARRKSPFISSMKSNLGFLSSKPLEEHICIGKTFDEIEKFYENSLAKKFKTQKV